ncbi:hypothetical protein [Oceanivirga miroungae]|uniref:Outer membrane protein beta-barrel domain-containing protein n=1 Tax=Oceanivirga miroungae TaxID=1130046 RepID=A0A6I8M924_9FUSO|nr:hypothetical protein [Oceanivirga miroungae]VWL84798.1 hypothetical protein OMES3154_00046 [Oceanivirga miroungae]
MKKVIKILLLVFTINFVAYSIEGVAPGAESGFGIATREPQTIEEHRAYQQTNLANSQKLTDNQKKLISKKIENETSKEGFKNIEELIKSLDEKMSEVEKKYTELENSKSRYRLIYKDLGEDAIKNIELKQSEYVKLPNKIRVYSELDLNRVDELKLSYENFKNQLEEKYEKENTEEKKARKREQIIEKIKEYEKIKAEDKEIIKDKTQSSKNILELKQIEENLNIINTNRNTKKELLKFIENLDIDNSKKEELKKNYVDIYDENLENISTETFETVDLENTKSFMLEELNIRIDKPTKDEKLEDYSKYADAFYYKNDNVFDKLKDNMFVDVKLDQELNKGKNTLGGLTLGGSYMLEDIKLNLGGFIQYDKSNAHNIALGFTTMYDNFLGFVRYRFAFKKFDNVLYKNHNLDIYAKYSYVFNFDKFNVEPIVSAYGTYSSKVNLGENVYLNHRFGIDFTIATKLSYKALSNLDIYATPVFIFAYNDQKIVKEKKEKPVKRSYFDYALKLGAKYKVDKFMINPELKVKGDMSKSVNLMFNVYLGYQL